MTQYFTLKGSECACVRKAKRRKGRSGKTSGGDRRVAEDGREQAGDLQQPLAVAGNDDNDDDEKDDDNDDDDVAGDARGHGELRVSGVRVRAGDRDLVNHPGLPARSQRLLPG